MEHYSYESLGEIFVVKKFKDINEIIELRDLEAFKVLIKNNSFSKIEMLSFLSTALFYKAVNIVNFLIESNVYIDETTLDFIFYWALDLGNHELVENLLKRGYNPDNFNSLATQQACINGDHRMLELLIEYDAHLDDTLLLLAINTNCPKLTNMLLEYGVTFKKLDQMIYEEIYSEV